MLLVHNLSQIQQPQNQQQEWMQREQSMRERYLSLKQQLSSQKYYPYTSTVLNLQSFVHQNQTLYGKLLKELKELRKGQGNLQKREVKIKTTPFYLQNMMNSKSTHMEDQTLMDLKGKNEIIRDNIARIRAERLKKQAAQEPVFIEKKKTLKYNKEEIQRMKETNKLLKRSIAHQDVLELYSQKCRECESLREVNNQLSEQLKKVITDINKMTGNEENPNMFLLSVGIR